MRIEKNKTIKKWQVPKNLIGKMWKKNPLCTEEMRKYVYMETIKRKYNGEVENE